MSYSTPPPHEWRKFRVPTCNCDYDEAPHIHLPTRAIVGREPGHFIILCPGDYFENGKLRPDFATLYPAWHAHGHAGKTPATATPVTE